MANVPDSVDLRFNLDRGGKIGVVVTQGRQTHFRVSSIVQRGR